MNLHPWHLPNQWFSSNSFIILFLLLCVVFKYIIFFYISYLDEYCFFNDQCFSIYVDEYDSTYAAASFPLCFDQVLIRYLQDKLTRIINH